jgi:hypothetical protein
VRPHGWPEKVAQYHRRAPVEALFLGVFELRQRFDRLLGRAREDDLTVLLLQLIRRNGDVMPADAHEASRTDDERHRTVGGDDEVVDDPHFLLLFVIHRLAKDLFLCTPLRCSGFDVR